MCGLVVSYLYIGIDSIDSKGLTSKDKSIGSMPAWGTRDPSSNPPSGKLVWTTVCVFSVVQMCTCDLGTPCLNDIITITRSQHIVATWFMLPEFTKNNNSSILTNLPFWFCFDTQQIRFVYSGYF